MGFAILPEIWVRAEIGQRLSATPAGRPLPATLLFRLEPGLTKVSFELHKNNPAERLC